MSEYLQTQEILKRVYNGTSLSVDGAYTSQDYFNAVFDAGKDALRVKVEGGSSSSDINVFLNGVLTSSNAVLIEYNAQNYTVKLTHNLDKRIISNLYDCDNKQAFIGVDYIDNNTSMIEFSAATYPTESNFYYLVIK